MEPEPCHCRFSTRNGRPDVDCEDCEGTGEMMPPDVLKVMTEAMAKKGALSLDEVKEALAEGAEERREAEARMGLPKRYR